MILLASYPKSGNTWLRALLTAYKQDLADIDISSIEGPQILSNRAMFDDAMGIASSEMPHNIVDRLRPDYFHHIAEQAETDQLIKLHDRFEFTDTGVPVYPYRNGVYVLYVVRNPLNVALSFAQHQGASVDNRIDEMLSPQAHMAGRPGFAYDVMRQMMGPWDKHVISWVDQTVLPVLTLRYENLLADTGAELARALAFIGTEVDPARVARAVEATRFDRMQTQESREGFFEKHPNSKRFFDKGPSRDWQQELTPQQVERLTRAFAPVMRRFRYL